MNTHTASKVPADISSSCLYVKVQSTKFQGDAGHWVSKYFYDSEHVYPFESSDVISCIS